jgi:hypothetical protein
MNYLVALSDDLSESPSLEAVVNEGSSSDNVNLRRFYF